MDSPSDILVLVIDDDRLSRMTLRRLLTDQGFSVEEAEDGIQGLAKARQRQPDLVLLDVVMPGVDGFGVCEELRQDPVLAEVPVFMLTSLGDHESRVRGLEVGADDFISKPYRPDVLRAKVKTVTGLNRFRRIRAERARFAWVVESAEEGYLLVDERGRLLYANCKARALLGFCSEARGEDVLECLRRDFSLQPSECWELWPNLPEDQPLQLLRAESEVAPAVWLGVKVLKQSLGSGQESLLQLRDITSEVLSQRSVWTFESFIGHKLRTPVTKITWGLAFLSKKAHKLSTAEVVEFAEMASQGVVELQRELDEVMRYLNAPSAIPEGGGFPLAQLEALLLELAGRLELPPCTISFDDHLPESVHLSPRAFELVLWELFQNSKKFHPRRLPRISLCVRQELGSKVVFEFEDDGARLTPEQLSRAFLPYYQGEKYFTGQIRGMGLGLSMVASLILEVGGECTLRNRVKGEGLVVELKLPIGQGK